MSKRYKINLGVSVVEEADGGKPFFESGICYRDAPIAVVQAVHEVTMKHAQGLLEALTPIFEELTDLGYEVGLAKGAIDAEEGKRIKEKFRGKK